MDRDQFLQLLLRHETEIAADSPAAALAGR
jgi:hypothetical protein